VDSTLQPTNARAFSDARTSWTIAALLALTHLVLAITAARDESPTFDEPTHLTAGYSYWVKNDYRLDPENGNLPARWASLPLLFGHLRFPAQSSHAWQHSSVGLTSRQFFFELGNDAESILLRGRLMMSLFGAALCLLIFAWTRSLLGTIAGLISETLMVFDPNMLAHGALVTSDVTAAFFFTAAVWSVWRLFHLVTWQTLILAALSIAGLFLTKMSAPSFLVMAGILGLVRICSKEPISVSLPGLRTTASAKMAKVAAIAALGTIIGAFTFLSIWAAFGFRYSALTENGQPRDILNARWDFFLDGTGATGNILKFVRDHHVLPEAFVYGVTYVTKNSQSRPSFLDEHWSNVGFRTFFLKAFLYKTPLPLIVLLALAVAALAVWSFVRWRKRKDADVQIPTLRPIQLAPLLVIIAVYGVFAWSTRLNIGHRHLLPLYPAIFILCGSCAWFAVRQRSKIGVALLCLLISWDVFSSFSIRPHYLAYFNESIGGPTNGYKHLVDSSLDWGQDLPELKSWIAQRPPDQTQRSNLYLAYFGTAKPAYYGIDATILPEDRHGAPLDSLGPGIYCISATILQHVYEVERGPWAAVYEKAYQRGLAWSGSRDANDSFVAAVNSDSPEADKRSARLLTFRALRFGRLCAYLRHQKPVANVGYSILVFRLSQADIDAALRGPPAELVPSIEVAGD
jgi:hypothetical protein